MKARLDRKFQNDSDEKGLQDLEDFSNYGLRTLLICQAEIEEDRYEEWNQEFYKVSLMVFMKSILIFCTKKASTALTEREEKIEIQADKIERNFRIVGISAIEDKLQVGVPETIQDLLAANIRIWVLTGDKRETAVNIAKSSSLITDQTILTLQFDDKISKWEELEMSDIEKDKKAFLKEVNVLISKTQPTGKDKEKYALVITGPTLNLALEDEVKYKFLELALAMETVVCCRVNPLQKSYVVKLVKDNKKDIITAAIGDGMLLISPA